jgi:hypothetical protein
MNPFDILLGIFNVAVKSDGGRQGGNPPGFVMKEAVAIL